VILGVYNVFASSQGEAIHPEEFGAFMELVKGNWLGVNGPKIHGYPYA
jgi:hypothetical protein